MTEFLVFFKDFWEILLLVATGIGGYLKWRTTRRKSTDMLYDEMEKLKQLVIKQVANDVTHAMELSEKNRLLAELELKCPSCYAETLKKLGYD